MCERHSNWRGWQRDWKARASDRQRRSLPTARVGCASTWRPRRTNRNEAVVCTRLNLYGLPGWVLRPRLAISSRKSRQTCWRAGLVCHWSRGFQRALRSNRCATGRTTCARRAGDATRFSARQPLDQLAHFCIEAALRDANLWEKYREEPRGAGARHRSGVDVALGGRQPEGGKCAFTNRNKTTIRRSCRFTRSWVSLAPHGDLGRVPPAATTPWKSAASGCARVLVDVCIAGACDLAVSRSVWRPSATCKHYRGVVTPRGVICTRLSARRPTRAAAAGTPMATTRISTSPIERSPAARGCPAKGTWTRAGSTRKRGRTRRQPRPTRRRRPRPPRSPLLVAT